jgi:predicted transcriptional regulator
MSVGMGRFYRAAVREGIEQADRGQFIEEAEMSAHSSSGRLVP